MKIRKISLISNGLDPEKKKKLPVRFNIIPDRNFDSVTTGNNYTKCDPDLAKWYGSAKFFWLSTIFLLDTDPNLALSRIRIQRCDMDLDHWL